MFFPQIVDSNGLLGTTARSVLGAEVTLGAIIGDQQCAAIAQGCRKPGEGKTTYGTSASFDMYTGPEIIGVQGTYLSRSNTRNFPSLFTFSDRGSR